MRKPVAQDESKHSTKIMRRMRKIGERKKNDDNKKKRRKSVAHGEKNPHYNMEEKKNA